MPALSIMAKEASGLQSGNGRSDAGPRPVACTAGRLKAEVGLGSIADYFGPKEPGAYLDHFRASRLYRSLVESGDGCRCGRWPLLRCILEGERRSMPQSTASCTLPGLQRKWSKLPLLQYY